MVGFRGYLVVRIWNARPLSLLRDPTCRHLGVLLGDLNRSTLAPEPLQHEMPDASSHVAVIKMDGAGRAISNLKDSARVLVASYQVLDLRLYDDCFDDGLECLLLRAGQTSGLGQHNVHIALLRRCSLPSLDGEPLPLREPASAVGICLRL